MFLLFYYIICAIGTFSLISYFIYQEDKYWIKDASIYDIIYNIDFGLIGIVIALSIFLGFILFPYMIILLIIGKIKGII